MWDHSGAGATAPSHSAPLAKPKALEIGMQNWVTAERAACEIVWKVQPTLVSEDRRRDVVHYIQRLMKGYLGAEVFPYGSVPLRTYLPDGDIDLTAFGCVNVEDSLAEDMKSVLEEEEKNVGAEFVIKDVQLIRAEVKLVKCIVQDIVIDVSFNQLGGLSTLCFLEQVDRLIGKDHMFKRSIILIKAWCYYESRILGAHHGLISTYALETLVLYIFHHFHSTLDGPLAVLYKFLDYFSNFDWDTYCISLNGPVRVSSLPAIVAEMPEDIRGGDLLLSSDFLNSCVVMFSVPSRSSEKNSSGFQQKHLNIVDPLKETNNLGRSVSKGNFYRIRSAFSYGARKLAGILMQPQDCIAKEINKFFTNTLARHRDGRRPDVQDFEPSLSYENIRSGGDSNELATSHCDDSSIISQSRTPKESANSAVDKPFFAPHLFFAKSKLRNGSLDSDKSDEAKVGGVNESQLVASRDVFRDPKGNSSDQSRTKAPESLNLSDLSGDYEGYLECFKYGQWCYNNGLSMLHSLPVPPYQNNGFLSSSHYKQQNGFFHRHHQNGFHHPNHQAAVYAMQPLLLPGVTFEVPKPRGTGLYFPNTPLPYQGYRPFKGRSQAEPRSPYMNGQNRTFADPNSLDRSMLELSQPQAIVDKSLMVVSSSDSQLSFAPLGNDYSINPNGLFIQPVALEELAGQDGSVLERSKQQKPIDSLSPKTLQRSEWGEQDRISLRSSSYRLKDEDDFPPLSV